MNIEEDLGPAVSDRLAYLFKRAQAQLARLHEEFLAPFAISAGELAILLLIDARANPSPSNRWPDASA